jgi:hypothetical protein
MAYILVGGQAKNIGKTTLICNIISAFSRLRWNAVKITDHQHDPPGCELRIDGRSWSIWEQVSPAVESDTSRFLRSGAQRAWLVRAEDDALEEAFVSLQKMLPSGINVIVESNRLGRVFDPDLFLLIVDIARPEFKASARQQLEKVDAILLAGMQGTVPLNVPLLAGKPSFQATHTGLDSRLAPLIRDLIDHD